MYFETLVPVKVNQNFSLNSGTTNYLFQISKAVGTKILLGKWNMIINFPWTRNLVQEWQGANSSSLPQFICERKISGLYEQPTQFPHSMKVPLKLNFEGYVDAITFPRWTSSSVNMISLIPQPSPYKIGEILAPFQYLFPKKWQQKYLGSLQCLNNQFD